VWGKRDGEIKSPANPKKRRGMILREKAEQTRKRKEKRKTIPHSHLILLPPVIIVQPVLVVLRGKGRE